MNTTVKILITGASGKMGGVIADVAKSRPGECAVIAGVDVYIDNCRDYGFPVFGKLSDIPAEIQPDVLIDFSTPAVLTDILSYCRLSGVPAVIATTGYSDDEIADIRRASNEIPLFFTFNFSLGVNLLSELVTIAAKALKGFDIEIVEKHHNLKKDAPSGTALMLYSAAESGAEAGRRAVFDRHGVRKPRSADEIGIHSVRGGTIVGEHDVIFAGMDEVITLSHTAASKAVFAAGAVSASVFLASQRGKPGLYSMNDLIADAMN